MDKGTLMKEYLSGKLHNITVTEANVNYTGSIGIDEDLMEKVGLEENQKVLVASTTSGARLETYVIKDTRGTQNITMNGAAAHLIKAGEKVIIMGFEFADRSPEPKVLIFKD